MAEIRPRLSILYGRENQPIRIPIVDLVVKNTKTFLTTDTASGSTSLTVKSTVDFDADDILLIGEPGNEGTEIITSLSSTTPYVTMTISTATRFDHSANSFIRVIDYDEVEIASATALTATKEAITTPTLVGDSLETIATLTTPSTGFYFARFFNTKTNSYSPYSDGVPVAGYTLYMARSIIDNALRMINKTTSDVMSDEYAFSEINNCQIEVIREFKRWSFLQEFNANLGALTVGNWRVALPSDCDDQNTNKSVWNFRIAAEKNLIWRDKEQWNALTQSVIYSTLSSPIAVGTVSVYVTDSSDFADDGSFEARGLSYDYTANDRENGILTMTASTTTAISGDDIFQNASSGNPTYWTTHGGYAYFYPILSDSYDQRDGHMDYYKKMTEIVSDTTEIVLPDPTVVQYYLAWKFLLRQNSGKEDGASRSMYNQYVSRRERLKSKETMNRTVRLKPTLNELNMTSEDVEGRRVRTQGFLP
jgi:hypothetical protein